MPTVVPPPTGGAVAARPAAAQTGVDSDFADIFAALGGLSDEESPLPVIPSAGAEFPIATWTNAVSAAKSTGPLTLPDSAQPVVPAPAPEVVSELKVVADSMPSVPSAPTAMKTVVPSGVAASPSTARKEGPDKPAGKDEPIESVGVKHASLPYAPTDVILPLPLPIPLMIQPLIQAHQESVVAQPLLSPVPPIETQAASDDGAYLRIRFENPPTVEPDAGDTRLPAAPAAPAKPVNPVSALQSTDSEVPVTTDFRTQAVVSAGSPRQRSGNDSDHERSTKNQAEAIPVATSPIPRSDATEQVVRVSEPSQKLPDPQFHRSHEAAPAASVPRQIPEPETQAKGALRAVSIDFTPDGSGDVRLKLAERSGEVHVSLHSNDASMTHQLREGIHDLASALASAGYDAETFSSGQGREQGRQQQREQNEQQSRHNSQRNDSPAFEGLLNQTGQEIV
jgi:hypothetical protein